MSGFSDEELSKLKRLPDDYRIYPAGLKTLIRRLEAAEEVAHWAQAWLTALATGGVLVHRNSLHTKKMIEVLGAWRISKGGAGK